MPAYLKYRDKGYMYSPHVAFIPFFRAVDECIKEVVNEKGMEQHGDKLVKVCCPYELCLMIQLSFCRLHTVLQPSPNN